MRNARTASLLLLLLLSPVTLDAAEVVSGHCRLRFLKLLNSGQSIDMLHVKIRPESVNEELPGILKAHAPDYLKGPQKKVKEFFRKPSTARFLYKTVNGKTHELGNLDGRELFQKLEPERKYNIVITGTEIKLMRINPTLVGDTLSKHLVIGAHSDDVRYAGEIWRELDGRVLLNINSGTYQPDLPLGDKAVRVLRKELDYPVELDATAYDYAAKNAMAGGEAVK